MVAAAGGLPLRLKILQQLVIQREHPAAVEGGFERLGISLAGDVFEELVHGVAPLEHRIVVLLGADKMWQGKLLARQVKLQRVGEGDLVRIVFAAGAALEKELALLADNQELGGFAGAARIIDDRVEHADVKVRHDDGKFFSGELLARSDLARLAGTGDAAALTSRSARLHAPIPFCESEERPLGKV